MSNQKYHPQIRLNAQGFPILKCTTVAAGIKKAFKEHGRSVSKPLSPEQVLANAKLCVGNPLADQSAVIGASKLQCGQYYGKSFKWLLENDPGYVVYIALDTEPSKGHGIEAQFVTQNLKSLVSYALQFPKMKKMIDMQKAQKQADKDAEKSGNQSIKLVGFGKFSHLTYQELLDQQPSYCEFIRKKSDVQANSRMAKLRNFLRQLKSAVLPTAVSPVPVRMALLSSHHSVSDRALKVSRSRMAAPNLKSARSVTRVTVTPSTSVLASEAPIVEPDTDTPITSSSQVPISSCATDTLPKSSTVVADLEPVRSLSTSSVTSAVIASVPESEEHLLCLSNTAEHDEDAPSTSSSEVHISSHTSGVLPKTANIASDLKSAVSSSSKLRSSIPGSGTKAYMRTQTTSTVPEPPPPSIKERTDLKWSSIVSPAQEKWMKFELRKLGLVPATPEYKDSSRWEGEPLWRTPPPGELQKRNPAELPTPDAFWLHPMFVWVPELLCQSLFGSRGLPCITPNCSGCAEKKGIGRPRVVVGSGGGRTGMPDTGQYYIFSSLLYCKKCKCTPWQADLPAYLRLLPEPLQNLFPAHVVYNKAICKSLLDKIRRSGRSCSDLSNEVRDLLQARYERAHQQYLLLLQQVRSNAINHSTLDTTLGFDASAESVPFGSYSYLHGWRGVSVSEEFIADMLIVEYNDQRPYLSGMMKGVFGRYWRSDHTRTLAKKVELLSGVMWSYATLNEFWEVVSWVMVDSDSEPALINYYKGLKRRYELSKVEKASITWVDRWCCTGDPTVSFKKGEMLVVPDQDEVNADDEDWNVWIEDSASSVSTSSSVNPDSSNSVPKVQPAVDRKKFERQSACRSFYNEDIVELLDAFHCIRRLGRACVSEAHPAYPRFLSLISCAFFVISEEDLAALQKARRHLNLSGEPTKNEVRRHCRTVIPPPQQLQERVEAVLKSFLSVKDASGLRLFTSRMLLEWRLQRTHIQRGCLSDPVVSGDSRSSAGVLYRLVGESHLSNIFCTSCQKVKCDQTKLKVWSPLRGSSQLEGFHPHQAKWVTGSRVSKALFQAQSFLGVGRWNWKRAVEHRNLSFPSVFDPRLVACLNEVHLAEYGCAKYPDFVCSDIPSGEHFGIEYCQDEQITSEINEVCTVSDSSAKQIVHIKHDISANEDKPDESADLDLGVDAEAHANLQKLLTCEEEDVVDMDVDSFSDADSSRDASVTPATITRKSPTKQQRRELTRNTFAGKVTYWQHEKWSQPTTDAINSLLAKHRGKERMTKILIEYSKMVLESSRDAHSQLQMTNRRFIQMYERTINRKLEGNAAVNFSSEQTQKVEDVTNMLQQPQPVSSHIVTSPTSQAIHPVSQVLPSSVPSIPSTQTKRKKRKRKKKEDNSISSDDSSDVDDVTGVNALADIAKKVFAQFLQQHQPNESVQIESSSSSSTTKAKKKKKNPKSGSNLARNCLHCGLPKSKIKSTGINLHHVYVRKGELCYHFCPQKVADKWGLPPTTTFDEFKSSEFWDREMEDVRQKKEETARKRKEATERREQQGRKKPGPPGAQKHEHGED